ncbi:pleiotropic regulatory protein RsmS [Vibrio cyclitrophicus]|uniref:pleiotropic regulatory protein RsmS n=1 Tax=Vibrio cyclitrophicus TaxID=47951 RepID=UPI0002E86EA5|nr:pleiotropic regulatory protein RsmS [Vibrio cyclitrophicus]OBT12647.1 primosomal protein [Vibrio cyclitrophicus]OEE09329.1 primosomal protein [Vibrio cyclitrophicus ZF264]
MNTDNTSSLDNAPEEVKLAVDLIYLLESNEIDPKVALEAIKIVQQDLQAKLASSI